MEQTIFYVAFGVYEYNDSFTIKVRVNGFTLRITLWADEYYWIDLWMSNRTSGASQSSDREFKIFDRWETLFLRSTSNSHIDWTGSEQSKLI